jgi:hypothetical protein
MSAPVANPNQKLRNPFPRWRLKNGLMSASDQELEASVESCERWALWCAGLLVLGVVAEVVLAPPYDSFLEQWGSAFANAAVAIGVGGEVLFGRMTSSRQHEIARRLRAGLAPRTLALEPFLAALEGIPAPTLAVRVLFLKDDRESLQLAEQIWQALHEGMKWETQLIAMADTAHLPSAIFAGALSVSGVSVLEQHSPEHQGVFTGTWGPPLAKGLSASLKEVALGY